MGEKNDYIQLPPMKKDTSADRICCINDLPDSG